MRIALAISGASGVVLGLKTLRALTKHGCEVHLVISKDACHTAVYELGKAFARPQSFIDCLEPGLRQLVHLYAPNDFSAPIASGSFRVDATVVAPCSMASLAAMAAGISDNLLRRMADVAIKERRPLLLVPREAPFSQIHLENMLKLSRLGAIILPPVPAWYVPMQTLGEMEDAFVGKLLQMLGIEDEKLMRSWKGDQQQRMDILDESAT